MARTLTCDVCGKPIERVALKLYKTPKVEPKSGHNDYTDSADVGPCCVVQVNEINWTRRKVRPKEASDGQ